MTNSRTCVACGIELSGRLEGAPRPPPRSLIYFGAAGGLVMGPILVGVAVLMISDIPVYEELLWLKSDAVTDIKFMERENQVHRVRLYNEHGYCLSISDKKQGFDSFLKAALEGGDFAIGYNREEQLFADDGKRYSMIYEIRVGDETVKSFNHHRRMILMTFGAIGLLGALICMVVVYTPRVLRRLDLMANEPGSA